MMPVELLNSVCTVFFKMVFFPIIVSCCVKKKCWCFVSEGMGAANQEEMVRLALGPVAQSSK